MKSIETKYLGPTTTLGSRIRVIDNGGSLEMGNWHLCGTTHCRGGWAVILAGDAGKMLEAIYGTGTAAALIYASSRPEEKVPDFFASNEDALADIRKCAAEQTATEAK